MDKKRRGIIEAMFDDAMQEYTDIVADIEWIQREIPVSSLRDLALGYFLGVLETVGDAYSSVPSIISMKIAWGEHHKDTKTIRRMLKRRLPEISDKINRELNV